MRKGERAVGVRGECSMEMESGGEESEWGWMGEMWDMSTMHMHKRTACFPIK